MRGTRTRILGAILGGTQWKRIAATVHANLAHFSPKRLSFILLACILWAALFVGAVSIAKLEIGYISWLCGSWGCLPETAPLVSVHAMWAVVVFGVGLASLSISNLRNASLWLRLGVVITAASLTWMGLDATQALSSNAAPFDYVKYPLYWLATHIDWPILQLIAACLVNAALLRQQHRSTR